MSVVVGSQRLDAPFPLEEYQRRWSSVLEEMKKRGLETLVIWQRSGGSYDRACGVFWLTNYASMASGQETSNSGGFVGRAFSALVFRQGVEPELHIAEPADATDLGQVAVDRVVGHDNLPRGLGERLRDIVAAGSEIGYVGHDYLPVMFEQELESVAPGYVWTPHDDLIFRVETVKSELELDAFRDAGRVTTEALTAVMHGLIAGESGSEAAARAAAIITEAGGGFQRIPTNYGDSPTMWSHGLYGFRPTKPVEGDLVRAWVYGPILHGLWLDPGRSAVCGNKPNAAQRKLLEETAQLMDDLFVRVRPGATPREVGRFCDLRTAELGYARKGGPDPWNNYGHGVGTYFQPPYIPAQLAPESMSPTRTRAEEPFVPGMVYTVEVFVTAEGVGTATFEDVFIIGEDSNELLTRTEKIFW